MTPALSDDHRLAMPVRSEPGAKRQTASSLSAEVSSLVASPTIRTNNSPDTWRVPGRGNCELGLHCIELSIAALEQLPQLFLQYATPPDQITGRGEHPGNKSYSAPGNF